MAGQGQGPTPHRLSDVFQAFCAFAHDAFKRGVVVTFWPHRQVQQLAGEHPGLMVWFDDSGEGFVRAVLMGATPNHWPALIVTDAVENALKYEDDRRMAVSMESVIEEAIQVSLAAQALRQFPAAYEYPWKPTQQQQAPQGQRPRRTQQPRHHTGTPPEHRSYGPGPRDPRRPTY